MCRLQCYFGKVKDSVLNLQTLALILSISFGFSQVPACSGQSRTNHLYWALPGRGRGWICGDHQPHCPLLQVRGFGAGQKSQSDQSWVTLGAQELKTKAGLKVLVVKCDLTLWKWGIETLGEIHFIRIWEFCGFIGRGVVTAY